MQLVEECFYPLPILKVPFFDQEVSGKTMLYRMAAEVFGTEPVRGGTGDPTVQFYAGKPQDIFKKENHYVLSLPLPLVARDEVNLHRSVFDELVVRIGNWKRNIALPLGLSKLDIDGARYEEDRLNIYFKIEKNQEIPVEALKLSKWNTLKARLSGK